MIDQPERHCVNFLRYALAKHGRRKSLLDSIDPEEIRALTICNRRDAWQPPKPPKAALSRNDEVEYRRAIVRAYLERWGNMKSTELERFGIDGHRVGRFVASMPDVQVEKLDNERSYFYTLNRA